MTTKGGTMKLIVAKQKNPKVVLKPGMKLRVVSVSMAGPDLKKPKKLAARLCGGTNTCIALVDIERDEK